jgi:hypothetical protein
MRQQAKKQWTPCFFNLYGIAKQFGESYATRFVRMLTKFKLRDEERGIIDLPSSINYQSQSIREVMLQPWVDSHHRQYWMLHI